MLVLNYKLKSWCPTIPQKELMNKEMNLKDVLSKWNKKNANSYDESAQLFFSVNTQNIRESEKLSRVPIWVFFLLSSWYGYKEKFCTKTIDLEESNIWAFARSCLYWL